MPVDAHQNPQPTATLAGDASTEAPPSPVLPSSVDSQTAPSWRAPLAVVALFAIALSLSLAVYLALAVPGRWFPGAVAKTWIARDLALVRGEGSLVGGDLVVTAPDRAAPCW